MWTVLFGFGGEIKLGGLIKLREKDKKNIVVQRKKKGSSNLLVGF